MSLFLPPEILDLIVDHLHDEPTTLRECCLVSKSWIPRTRAHIFDHVELSLTRPALKRWRQTFPDPSNSPARYTRSLHLSNIETITVEIPDVLPQIRSFDHIVELTVVTDVHHLFTQLRGLSPNLKYLHISHCIAPLSDVLDFICSFPLLEDLVLHYLTTNGNPDGWDALPTSPKFTGSFRWSCSDRDIVHKLLGLPGGLHLSKIVVFCSAGDSGLLNELVSKCSDTLESLGVQFYRAVNKSAPPPLLDLSGAKRLKDVEFRLHEPQVKWIDTTLQTAISENLQQITIHLVPSSSSAALLDRIDEATRLEWQDLDHLLVRLWTTFSIRPVFTYEKRGGGTGSGLLVPKLLPELVKRGIVNVSDYY